jgi:hypothetical protein
VHEVDTPTTESSTKGHLDDSIAILTVFFHCFGFRRKLDICFLIKLCKKIIVIQNSYLLVDDDHTFPTKLMNYYYDFQYEN